MVEKLMESLQATLSYLASETFKSRKCGKNERAEKLSIAFKILLNEYDKIGRQ